ncbi:MAG: PEP-CTERM sorting domain-containing protein, partial [Gammaproteobacteria bacterium]|nr:PEP-CTERM sorting domain-containing protein [Gammaproteobacteria bacterium]
YIWFDGTTGDANYVDTVFRRPPDFPDWISSGIVQPAAFRVNGADVAGIPEPGTLVLIGFGMVGLAITRRRRS